MGDDRPIAYREGDNIIFRASSLGRDVRCFLAALHGYDPLPAPQYLIDAAEAGNRFEGIVKDMMRDDGYVITGEQGELEWEPVEGLIVRGHLDGQSCVGSDGVDRMLEVKSMSERRFSSWLKKGMAGFPSYAWQLSVYMHTTGKDATYAVVNRETNELDIVDIAGDAEFLIGEATMKRKLLLVRHYLNKGVFPKCTSASEFMCPYEYMCDRQPPMFEEVEDGSENMLIRLAQEYVAARDMEAEVKAKKASIRAELLTALGKRERVRVPGFSLVISTQTDRKTFDKQKARMELGEDKLLTFYKDAGDITKLTVKETE